MAEYNNAAVTAARSTEWIFGSFDPGVEYRSKPGSEQIVERRRRAEYVRYRNHQGPVTFSSQEGAIAEANELDSDNGKGDGGVPTTGNPTSGTLKWILSDHKLENEGGQGSGMYREIEVWETFTVWEEWDVAAELGTNPFS